MNTRESFGKKIAELRTVKRINQEELAERAGITQSNLSRIEKGKYNPGLDILQRIADALDMEFGFVEVK
jgi:transcriptional regulator with XRE-family HTH domain